MNQDILNENKGRAKTEQTPTQTENKEILHHKQFRQMR